ncbi:hypothetical protein [Saccharibacillus alkalitolerans]|uniref:Aminoglycoside phosphotransferase domain-containing protein n=1 Tax=Saccharibacillus alkalitolerans TaxID=2705290 RepID=A0ABX0F3Z6_9BACL|nr:hypothetical protein [Saccharibacillus alkalitolerans]NGZ75215.1 hypothetical protein [Saccharibacillus alkalitolerans]
MILAPRIYATIQHLFMKGIIETVELREKPESEEEGKRTYLLTADGKPKYALRMDAPENIAMAEQLYKAYPDSPLLPKLLYADPVKGYLVQPYVDGTAGGEAADRGSKKVWLPQLVDELLNRYEADEAGGKWGRLTEPCSSWSEFNERELSKARENLNGLQPAEDCERVALLLEPLAEAGGKYLLHGGMDARSLVFRKAELVGVLEPKPTAGPVLYDFVQAFCSTPDDLSLEVLFGAYSGLGIQTADQERLVQEALLRLYCRMGVCAAENGSELPEYLAAWQFWRMLLPEA